MSGLSEITAPNVVREAITAGGGRDRGALLARDSEFSSVYKRNCVSQILRKYSNA